MKQTLHLAIEVELFNTEDVSLAEKLANETDGVLYSWKTSGFSNWLEKGLSLSDVLGIVVLPRILPEQIEMPDDEPED